MASNRIVRLSGGQQVPLRRGRSEPALGDAPSGVTPGAGGVRGHTPGTGASPGGGQPDPPPQEVGREVEVVALRDHRPSSLAALGFSAGERLVVLDASGADWWYAHNQREMGFIPAAAVRPLGPADRPGGAGPQAEVLTLTPGAPEPRGRPGAGGRGRNLRGWAGTRSVDLMVFDTSPSPPPPSGPSPVSGEGVPRGFPGADVFGTSSPPSPSPGAGAPRGDPVSSLRGRRSHSLSELSVVLAPPPSSSFGPAPTGLRAPAPEHFRSRESFRAAWLSHRRLARSCHDLDSLLSPGWGWGQTQPVEASVVCRLDHRGGVVQLPDTHISVLVPEGQVGPGASQQVSLRALLDPPLALSGELFSTVSPLLEVRLSGCGGGGGGGTGAPSFLTLEARVAVDLQRPRGGGGGAPEARLLCVRSGSREGPYEPVPSTYLYRDTVQVQLDRLQPLMYVALVVQAGLPPAPAEGAPPPTVGAPAPAPAPAAGPLVWEQVLKKMTLALYGPKHLHPSFKTVVALFGHDCAPRTLLVSGGSGGGGGGGGGAPRGPPVLLHLWGKHQFALAAPQDLRVGLYSNTSAYEVAAGEAGEAGAAGGTPAAPGGGGDGGGLLIPGFTLRLGRVVRLLYTLTARDPRRVATFTLRVQVRDPLGGGGGVLAQFCVQTPSPAPPPSAEWRRAAAGAESAAAEPAAAAVPRRFLKRKQAEQRILLSPLALPSKPAGFQDRRLTNLRFGRLTKTVSRRHKNPYLLEYRRGDAVALLSEERVRLRGGGGGLGGVGIGGLPRWGRWGRAKEWYVGWSRGRLGLVHVANVQPLGRVRPPGWAGPEPTTAALLEQSLRPCRALTYAYAPLRALLMENVAGWRAFADALGYAGRPLDFFCWAAPADTEPERVASVLEKLKEECGGGGGGGGTGAGGGGGVEEPEEEPEEDAEGNPERRSFQRELFMGLLKMDLQGVALRLLLDLVLLTAAVELGPRWRELAARLAHVSPRQMDAYEAPHRDRSGLLDHQSMWRPAYDFLLTWAAAVGECCRDVLQELQLGLDRMRSPAPQRWSPAPQRWRHLTGVLLLVHALDPLRSAAFCPRPTHPDTPI